MHFDIRPRHAVRFMLLSVAGIMVMAGGVQGASVNQNQWVETYRVHAIPGDESSPVEWAIQLSMEAVDSNELAVAWRILTIEVLQFDAEGSEIARWTTHDPTVGTEDGLWWVQHAAPTNLQSSDFRRPPLLSGNLTTNSADSEDLYISFLGKSDEEYLEIQPFGGDFAILDFAIFVGDDEEPTDSGSDEPVESGGREPNDPD